MDIKLIAMDLDGTALSADRLHFTPRLQDDLLRAHRRGIAVLPVTGRQYKMLPPALQSDAPWRGLVVLCNGAQVRRFADGAQLYARFFPTDTLFRLEQLANEQDLPVEFSSDSVLYLTTKSLRHQQLHESLLDFHLHHILPAHGHVTDDIDAVLRSPGFACEKVNLPYVPQQRQQRVCAALNALPVSWAFSGAFSIEVSPPFVSKASGLQKACDLLGIQVCDVLAIGDSGNDVPMLRLAGMGVAMGNAPDDVKSAARAVTATAAEDGAALAIERWALGEEAAEDHGRSAADKRR